MLDVTVKTLDGQNRSFSVPDDITVREFKEKIANSINISTDSQRVIFQGRVLQDDRNLNFYDVNGKTLHVVQRPPPSARQSATATRESQPDQTDRPGEMRTFVGSFTLPSDIADPNEVQNIVQSVLAGLGDVGRNARISTSSSSDGSSVDVRINLGQIGPGPQGQNEAQNRLRLAERMIARARRVLDTFENATGDEEDAMEISPNEGGTPERDQTEAQMPAESSTTTSSRPGDNNRQMDDTERMRADDESDTRRSPDRQNNNNRPAGSSSDDTRTPSTRYLAQLLRDVFTINRRLQPHLERYEQLMEQDPSFGNDDSDGARTAQRLCDTVSRVMHYVSHIYHHLSDLMVDLQQDVPRVLRSNPVTQQVAIVQQTIPIQAQINVTGVSPRGSPQLSRRSTTSSTVQSTAASATSTSSSSSSSSSSSTVTGSAPANIRMQGSPLRFSRPIGMVPPVVGFSRGRHPFMMMDVRPQNLHINNITAQIVRNSTSAGTSTTGTTTSSSSGSTTDATTGVTPTTQPSLGTTPATGGAQLPFQLPPGIFGGQLPPGAEHLPRPILQNIIQMAAQSAMGSLTGQPQVIVISQDGTTSASNTPSTATGSSSATTTTTTGSRQTSVPSNPQSGQTQTGTTQTDTTQSRTAPESQPSQPHGATFVFPGPRPGLIPPPGFMGTMHGLDPYLPCHSRFFVPRQQDVPSGGSTGQTASNDGQPNNALADVLSGIISSIVNQIPSAAGVAHVEVHTPGTQTSTSQSQSSSVSASTRQTTTTSGTTTSPNPAIDELRNLLQSARTATNASSSQSGTGAESSQPANQQRPMGEEMFARLLSGIGNYVSQAAMGQQPSETIYDFSMSLGQEYSRTNEGLLTDIFVCVSRHLTIVDLMSIFCHQVAPLQRLVQPLQEFVRDRVLQGREANDENIDRAVEQLVEEILPQIEEICTYAPVRDNIDFPASVQELLRFHFIRNIHLIQQASESNPQFAEDLYNNVRLLVHEFLTLSQYCLDGGQQAVERLVQANMSRISADVSPVVQQWMANVSVQRVQSVMRNIQVTEEQIQGYIVRRTDIDTGRHSQSSDASFVSAESGDREKDATGSLGTDVAASNNDVNEVMDTEGSAVSNHPGTDITPHIPAELLQRLPPPPQVTENIPVVVGSESWHSQVPPEWVEVITHDAHRQQQLPVQPPFSDAYINGMPAKRRKLMNRGPDEARELADIKTMLPQAIGRAAEATGAEPITSQEDMERDAAGSTTLREAFQQEMNDSIRKRLREDSDYIAEKYPNTEKYYHNKK